ncbi:MAG: sugar phosphate isomerase/epimerase [Armatimonadetes bacterium]|nr:sugar phosphate isomerase/epimerase [Armatimonadota bacterium]
MLWGFAGPWYGEFLKGEDGSYPRTDFERLKRQLMFLLQHELKCTGVSVELIAQLNEEERDWLGNFLASNDLSLVLHVGYDYINADEETVKAETERVINLLSHIAPLVRSPLAATTAHAGHRFDRKMALEQKLERLTLALTPLARGCHELGLPFAIENHCDFYISDLVSLCQSVPHLGILLDTGNTYVIGEKPLPAFEEAAPFALGTHFKDHFVRPRPDLFPLCLEVDGAPLGEGDVPLRECYEILKRRAPNPEKLVMLIEMVAPKGMNPLECWEKSLKFVRKLAGGNGR